MKKHAIIVSVLFLLLLNSCFLFGPTDHDGSLDHNSVLENLGINTNLGDPEDPSGNPLRGGYNPLGREVTVFNKLDEFYVSGIQYDVAGSSQLSPEMVFDDSSTSYNIVKSTSKDDITTCDSNCLFKSEAGDVDGDGQEEVVFVSYNQQTDELKVRTVNDSSGNYSTSSFFDIDTVTPNDWDTVFDFYKLDLSTGDIDGDARDEIAVVCYHKLYILDDANHGFNILTSKTYPTTGLTGNLVVRVAVGEINEDGREDIVVVEGINDQTGGCYYHVYSGAGYLEINPSGIIYPNIGGTSYNFEFADVSIGDYDGDKYNEIAFSGDCGEGNNFRTVIADDFTHGYNWLNTSFAKDISWEIYKPPITKTLDIDGDYKDEILAERAILGIDASGELVQKIGSLVAQACRNAVAVGDVTGDGKDEVVTVEGTAHDIYIQGYNPTGTWTNLRYFLNTAVNPTICTANMDSDSPVVKYTGEHELLFPDPTVIAVLACPPYHANIGQNIDNSGTTFGQSTATGIEKTTSTGFSVGFSIGYEYEDPLNLSKASFKITVENSMDWISSNSVEIGKAIAYSSGPDEDKVIFTAVPFDVYYYEVLSSPDPVGVGSRICINIPREMQTIPVSRSFYNDNNGDSPDIDSYVLSHKIGDVSTYPTLQDKNIRIAGGGLESVGSSVGVGSGATTLTVSITESEGTGTAFDFSVTVESEVGAGGFTVGYSAGFHQGYEYFVTNTYNTFYQGTVGHIPDGAYTPDKAYQFGLFTFPYEYGEQKFTVVDYWVE